MRRIPAALAVIGLTALALVGCSANQPPTCDRVSSTGNVADLVSVTGEAGTAPDVEVSLPFRTESVEYADVTRGGGVTLIDENQGFALGFTIIDGTTGEQLIREGYDSLTAVTTIARWDNLIPGFRDALMCATDGSRIVVGLSSGDFADGVAAQIGLAEGDSAVAVLDLRQVYLSAADGADQFNESRGLPTVVRAPDGRPGVLLPDAAPPADTVVQVVKKGDGDVVAAGDTVGVNLMQVDWQNRTVTENSWGSGPARVIATSGANALTDALIGQTVGSQVLIVTPTDLVPPPAGTAPSGPQVFVVDVLGIQG